MSGAAADRCEVCAEGDVVRDRECVQCRQAIRVCEECAFDYVHQIEDPNCQSFSRGIFDFHFLRDICEDCYSENLQRSLQQNA